MVGRRDGSIRPDIELSGLGIQADHCVLTVELEPPQPSASAHDPEVGELRKVLYVTPRPGARTCVNGKPVAEKTALGHGDRIVWGNHHFYRVNCPDGYRGAGAAGGSDLLGAGSRGTGPECLDYDFARRELERNELKEDPIQLAIASLEKQHEADKQGSFEVLNIRHDYCSSFRSREAQYSHLRTECFVDYIQINGKKH